MAKGAGKARKKLPKELAVVHADNCTGCEACIEVVRWIASTRCLAKNCPACRASWTSTWTLHRLRVVCQVVPWDAIDMIPTPRIADAVAAKGGPPEYVEKNWDKLVRPTPLAELAVEQQAATAKK